MRLKSPGIRKAWGSWVLFFYMVEFGNSEIREFGNLVILRGCATSFSFYLFAHGNSKIWEFGSVRFVSGLTNKIGSQEKFFFSHGNLEIRKFGDFAGAPLLFFFLFICSREFENSEIRKFAFRFRPHEQKWLTRKVFFLTEIRKSEICVSFRWCFLCSKIQHA